MAHHMLTAPRVVVLFTALALAGIGTGCGSSDTGGGGGQGQGGDGGDGGAGGSGAEACDTAGTFRGCDLPGDAPGQPSGGQECVDDGNGGLAWNDCELASTAASTPLVLSFDGAPVAFAAGLSSFDLAGDMSVVTDWPAASTPWLALDRDGNAAIDDGRELFGSATLLDGGARATNGFEALAELDSDGDGRITAADAAWSSLRLWSDADGDRVSSAGELSGLGARRLLSIDLGYTSVRSCDLRGNCEIERATFRFTDESGAERSGVIVDVHLKHR
jgi:hypothetical protein